MEKNNNLFFFFEVSYQPKALCMLMSVPSVFWGVLSSLQEFGAWWHRMILRKNHVGDLYKNVFQLSHKLEVKLW